MSERILKEEDFELGKYTEIAAKENGISILDLSAGDVVEIETESGHIYAMKVLDPSDKRVEVTSNDIRYITKPTITRVIGSRFNHRGSAIRLGYIEIGLYIELAGLDLGESRFEKMAKWLGKSKKVTQLAVFLEDVVNGILTFFGKRTIDSMLTEYKSVELGQILTLSSTQRIFINGSQLFSQDDTVIM